MGLFLKIKDYKSSNKSESEIMQTVKKDPRFQFNKNYDPNFNYSSSQNTVEKHRMTKQ